MLGEILSQLVLMLGAFFIAYYFLCYDNCPNCGMKRWKKESVSTGHVFDGTRVCAICGRTERSVRVGYLKKEWVEDEGTQQ